MPDGLNNIGKQPGRPFKPGTSGNPRGRPKGSRNKRTCALVEAAQNGGELPLDYMLRVMRDPNAAAKRRDEMAKAAAPYLHSKLDQPSIPDRKASLQSLGLRSCLSLQNPGRTSRRRSPFSDDS
jgi:hypothetical protein